MNSKFYVCTSNQDWLCGHGPKKNEIVTLIDTDFDGWGLWFKFEEYPPKLPWLGFYNPDYFRPVDLSFGSETCEKIEQGFVPEPQTV